MAISTNESVQFNISNIQDNQILVYDASTGSFVNETSAVSANANVTGLGRNIGSQGVGLYAQNDNQYLEFYKLQSGANTTLSLNDNVLTIDAVVGTSAVNVSSSNANTVAVFDSTGNVLAGNDFLILDNETLTLVGSNNNVSFVDGTITATTLNVANFSVGGNFNLPTTDGNANQIMVTDGNGTVTWVDNTDISTKVDTAVFNAYQATALTEVANHAPALNNLYSLGNSTHKYSQIFSTYFRGTADLAVNAQNLGSQPAANYMLRSDTYDADQIDALIANVTPANSNVSYLSSITVTDGTISYTDAEVDIRSADSNITVTADPVLKTITLTSNVQVYGFQRVAAEGNINNYIVADRVNDVLNFVGGTGITVSADPNSDTITINATGSGGANIANSSITDLSDVDTTGITNGQTLIWSASNSQFEPGTVSSNVSASTLTIGTRSTPVSVSLSGGSTLNIIGRTSNVAVSLS